MKKIIISITEGQKSVRKLFWKCWHFILLRIGVKYVVTISKQTLLFYFLHQLNVTCIWSVKRKIIMLVENKICSIFPKLSCILPSLIITLANLSCIFTNVSFIVLKCSVLANMSSVLLTSILSCLLPKLISAAHN